VLTTCSTEQRGFSFDAHSLQGRKQSRVMACSSLMYLTSTQVFPSSCINRAIRSSSAPLCPLSSHYYAEKESIRCSRPLQRTSDGLHATKRFDRSKEIYSRRQDIKRGCRVRSQAQPEEGPFAGPVGTADESIKAPAAAPAQGLSAAGGPAKETETDGPDPDGTKVLQKKRHHIFLSLLLPVIR
jgi:hypothetical protein